MLGEIQKNKKTKLVIKLSEYKGHKFVDVREYFINKDNTWVPTKRGMTFKPALVTEVINVLEKAEVNLLKGREADEKHDK